MRQPPIIRRRRRNKRSLPLSGSRGGFALREPLPTGPRGEAPRLALREPEGTRRVIVSGALSAILHLALLGAIALTGWLAPDEVMQKIIPVEIIREKPGSHRPPPPARPKALKPRPPRTLPAPPARTLPRVAPQTPVQPAAVAPIDARAIQMQNLGPLNAPTELRRRQVTSRQVTARSTAASPDAAAVAPVAAVTVRPGDLRAPQVDFEGPRQIAPGTQPLISPPEALTKVSDVAPGDYQAVAPDAVLEAEGDVDAAVPFTIEFDTSLTAEHAEGGVVGGTGTTSGVVPCMQSAFVERYRAEVERRVYARWQIPPGTPPEREVVLVFRLDVSGAATSIEFKGEVDPALGRSAVAAMREASPFPPMDDNVRCLAEIRLRGTFKNSAY